MQSVHRRTTKRTGYVFCSETYSDASFSRGATRARVVLRGVRTNGVNLIVRITTNIIKLAGVTAFDASNTTEIMDIRRILLAVSEEIHVIIDLQVLFKINNNYLKLNKIIYLQLPAASRSVNLHQNRIWFFNEKRYNTAMGLHGLTTYKIRGGRVDIFFGLLI